MRELPRTTPRSAPPPLPSERGRVSRFHRVRRTLGNLRNDLLGWEVLRAGRRTGTLAIGRVAIGGLLLAAMWALWAAFGENIAQEGSGTEIGKRLNRFAEWFSITFFLVQITAVLLLTPVFVAAAIFEERETRSGEVLLTTQLTRREVYVGKLGARMVQVLLVVLASMPILFLTLLWGGVALENILINYCATILAVLGAGVVTAAVSAYAESMRAAILRTYGLLFLIDVVFIPSSPYAVIFMTAAHWVGGVMMLLIYATLQIVVVLVGYMIGQRWLRMAMLRQKRRIATRAGAPPPLPGQRARKLPPLNDSADPLLWKELNCGGRITPREVVATFTRRTGRPTIDDRLDEMGPGRWLALSRESTPVVLRVLALGTAFILFGLTLFNLIPSNWAVRYAGGLGLCWLVAAVGLTAATSVARERQKNTLIDMLMLPRPRRDLLRAKLLAALARGLWPGIALALLLLTAVVGLGISLLAVLCLALTAAGLTLFAAFVGIFLTVRCRTALNATAIWISIMAGLVVATFLFAEATQDTVAVPGGPLRVDYPSWSRTINPLLAWGRLAFRYDYSADQYVWGTGDRAWSVMLGDVWPALFCPAVYALIGGVLWLVAVRRFEKEGRS